MPPRKNRMPRGKKPERGGTIERRARLRPVSAAQAAENRLRRKIVSQLFGEQPVCAGPCGGNWADDVHEPLTRTRGGSITDPANMVPLCRPCHDLVTFAPESELGWAYDAGLLRHSWDGAA